MQSRALGVVHGKWKVQMVKWRAHLHAGHSCTAYDDDIILVIVLAILYSRGVWGWRVGVLGVIRGEWRWWG